MELFPRWTGTLRLPPLPERSKKIGKNTVIQRVFGGLEAKAKIFRSGRPGYDVIQLETDAPFNELLLRHKRAHKTPTKEPVVTSEDLDESEDFPDHFTLKWESLGILAARGVTPDDVLANWDRAFKFKSSAIGSDEPGLRPPQIGALHAIAAHFSVGSEFEPATVVLPTGTGKTDTMLATLVYLRLKRTLVLVPSDALRGQISKKFIDLGVLADAETVSKTIARPRVAVLKSGLKSIAEAREILENANVIVSLPNSIHESQPSALRELVNGCTDLIVDEAHHIPAKSWAALRSHFDAKRVIQFTATPYRRDGKRIDGKIIFNYKLGDAQRDEYYQRINLRTIAEYGDESERDIAIAREAIAALRRDREELNLDHLLMARTSQKERAKRVAEIYQSLAPEYKPQLIYSGPGRTEPNRTAKEMIQDRGPDGARIIVCVDMLGEGFDLPNLKIAAFHDVHKSLAISLQFIGRFTRSPKDTRIGEATAVVNLADAETEGKLSALYSEGAEWDKIIRRLSEDRIESEIRLEEVVSSLKEFGDLHSKLSLWNLRPALSAQFFRTAVSQWNPNAFSQILPKNAVYWHAYSEQTGTLVAVVCRDLKIDWGEYQSIYDTVFDLLILRWVASENLLCVYASDFKGLKTESLAEAVTDVRTELISGDVIFNVLNNVNLPLVKNLGSSRIGAISFTSYFGPNVTEGLADIEKSESQLSNIACVGYECGERVLWGCASRRGKIWQHSAGTISGWIEWTNRAWEKMKNSSGDTSNVTRDFLRPQKLEKHHDSYPISIQWGEQAQTKFGERYFIEFDGQPEPLFAIDLAIYDVRNNGAIDFSVSSETKTSIYRLYIDKGEPGGYSHTHISGPKLTCHFGGRATFELTEYLRKRDPFIIRYADGTYSYNCYHIPTNLSAFTFDRAKIESFDWKGIDLTAESMGKDQDPKTIQFRVYERIRDEHDLVFNDDDKGEAADLVCIKETSPDTLKLTLVHCKGAHEGRVSKDIRNFYTLCGQAQKSVIVKHLGIPALIQNLIRREDRWKEQGKTRILKGDRKLLSTLSEKSRRSKLEFEMILVQPGASTGALTDDISRLLGTTELFVKKTTQGTLRVILSE
ncbi:MAG: DEAD/DEAH box helicase family protein [Verrucomicrobiae bacterium]|nr:DEAD/DEAH box helicase family protein [Verrucomicrobiae bacterium]